MYSWSRLNRLLQESKELDRMSETPPSNSPQEPTLHAVLAEANARAKREAEVDSIQEEASAVERFPDKEPLFKTYSLVQYKGSPHKIASLNFAVNDIGERIPGTDKVYTLENLVTGKESVVPLSEQHRMSPEIEYFNANGYIVRVDHEVTFRGEDYIVRKIIVSDYTTPEMAVTIQRVTGDLNESVIGWDAVQELETKLPSFEFRGRSYIVGDDIVITYTTEDRIIEGTIKSIINKSLPQGVEEEGKRLTPAGAVTTIYFDEGTHPNYFTLTGHEDTIASIRFKDEVIQNRLKVLVEELDSGDRARLASEMEMGVGFTKKEKEVWKSRTKQFNIGILIASALPTRITVINEFYNLELEVEGEHPIHATKVSIEEAAADQVIEDVVESIQRDSAEADLLKKDALTVEPAKTNVKKPIDSYEETLEVVDPKKDSFEEATAADPCSKRRIETKEQLESYTEAVAADPCSLSKKEGQEGGGSAFDQTDNRVVIRIEKALSNEYAVINGTLTEFKALYLGWLNIEYGEDSQKDFEARSAIEESMILLFRFVFGNKKISEVTVNNLLRRLRVAYTNLDAADKIPCNDPSTTLWRDFEKSIRFRRDNVWTEILAAEEVLGVSDSEHHNTFDGLLRGTANLYLEKKKELHMGLRDISFLLMDKSSPCFMYGRQGDTLLSDDEIYKNEEYARILALFQAMIEDRKTPRDLTFQTVYSIFKDRTKMPRDTSKVIYDRIVKLLDDMIKEGLLSLEVRQQLKPYTEKNTTKKGGGKPLVITDKDKRFVYDLKELLEDQKKCKDLRATIRKAEEDNTNLKEKEQDSMQTIELLTKEIQELKTLKTVVLPGQTEKIQSLEETLAKVRNEKEDFEGRLKEEIERADKCQERLNEILGKQQEKLVTNSVSLIEPETQQGGAYSEDPSYEMYCDGLLTLVLLELQPFDSQELLDKAAATLDDIGQCRFVLKLLLNTLDGKEEDSTLLQHALEERFTSEELKALQTLGPNQTGALLFLLLVCLREKALMEQPHQEGRCQLPVPRKTVERARTPQRKRGKSITH